MVLGKGACCELTTVRCPGASTLTGLVTATGGVTTATGDIVTTGTGDIMTTSTDGKHHACSLYRACKSAHLVLRVPGDIKTTGGGNIASSGTLSVTGASTLVGAVTISSSVVATGSTAAASLKTVGGLAVGEKGFFGAKLTVESGGIDVSDGGVANIGAVTGLTSLAGTGAITATAGGALSLASGTGTNIALAPGGAGKVTIGGTSPTLLGAEDADLAITAGGSARSIALSPTGTGAVTIGGTAPTVQASTDADLTLIPGATNRNIVLAPTGKGWVQLDAGLVYGFATDGAATGGNTIASTTTMQHFSAGSATSAFAVAAPADADITAGRALWIRNDSGYSTSGDFTVANGEGCLYVFSSGSTWVKFFCST